jgi:hypothetical protein
VVINRAGKFSDRDPPTFRLSCLWSRSCLYTTRFQSVAVLTVYSLYTYCILNTAGWRKQGRKLHLPHGLRSLVPGSMRNCLTSLRHGAPPPMVTSPTDLSPPWCAPASCRLARSVPCCVARPSPPRRPPRAPQSPVRTQSDAIRRNQTQSDAIRRNQTPQSPVRTTHSDALR